MSPRLSLAAAAAALAACAAANVAVNRSFDFTRVARVAVVAFQDANRKPGTGEAMTGAFEQSLTNAGYDVAERGQVAKALFDQKVSGQLNPKTAAAVGRELGVDALVVGRITELVEPRQTVVNTDVVEDRQDPVYVRKVRRVQQPDGSWADVRVDEVEGYKTRHVIRKQPESFTVSGRVGVSVRMLYAPDAAVLWSGSDSIETNSISDGASALADEILKAVKQTWPKSRK